MRREANTRVEDVRQSTDPSTESPVGPEWVNLMAEAPARFSGTLFGFMAKRLHAQAALLEELAACRSAPEMIERQMEFLGAAWRDVSAEVPELWSAVQPKPHGRKGGE
jgi:hypothetical protein